MPATSTAKHPRLPFTMTFTEDGHTYIDNEASDYISTTTLVGKFFAEFDAPAKALEMADGDALQAAVTLATWKLNCDTACDYGTRVHEYAEACILGTPLEKPASEKERVAFGCVERALSGIIKHYEIVSVEAIVFDPVYRIAGSIDLRARHRATGRLATLDWKTNKKLDLTPRYPGNAHPPISHIPDCNGNHYRLQLAIYEQLLRGAYYIDPDEPVDNAIIYIPPFNSTPQWVPLQPAQPEALAMISAWDQAFSTAANITAGVTVAQFLSK